MNRLTLYYTCIKVKCTRETTFPTHQSYQHGPDSELSCIFLQVGKLHIDTQTTYMYLLVQSPTNHHQLHFSLEEQKKNINKESCLSSQSALKLIPP